MVKCSFFLLIVVHNIWVKTLLLSSAYYQAGLDFLYPLVHLIRYKSNLGALDSALRGSISFSEVCSSRLETWSSPRTSGPQGSSNLVHAVIVACATWP